MKLPFGFVVALGASASLVNTLACSAKVTLDMGSNDVGTGGTTASTSPNTGGATSIDSTNQSTGGAAAQSIEVIAGDTTIFELTTDSGSVYWPAADFHSDPTQSTATLSIRSYSPAADAGGVNTSLLATLLPTFYYPPTTLRIDGDWMYWIGEAYDVSDMGRLYRCHTLGCSDVQSMGLHPYSYTVSDGELYWTADSGILRCDADDCAASTSTIDVQTPSGQPKFQGAGMLVVDGEYLYMNWGGGLARVPRAGSAPYEPIEPREVWEYFIHGDQIYWTERTNPLAVYSCPKSGCTGDPTPVMKNTVYGQHITHDNDTIYVLNMPTLGDPTPEPGNQQLLRCPMTGCDNPVVVLGKEFSVYAVASDNEHIFAAVGLPSTGLPSVNPADYCSGASGCIAVLQIPK